MLNLSLSCFISRALFNQDGIVVCPRRISWNGVGIEVIIIFKTLNYLKLIK